MARRSSCSTRSVVAAGRTHVTPLVYLPDGERWAVVGSKGGAPADPDWVRNLETNEEATIEVGTETIPVRATQILRGGPEWDDLYARQVARREGFADYLVKTEGIRTIPVIVLERRAEASRSLGAPRSARRPRAA